jgi:metallophosphoesterase superfamily enzyme
MRVHADWLLVPERAAVHLPTGTVVVADLHLGYSQARRHGGEAVPLPDLGQTLAPLAQVAARHGVRRLVVAGDLFEAGASPGLVEDLFEWLARAGLELAGVVPGNHDGDLRQDGHGLPLHPEGMVLGGWRVLHGDTALPDGPVAHGHIHPCLRWGSLAAPCFLVGPGRLVLPAFSRDAAGAGVFKDARWRSYRCCVPAGERVLDFGELRLLRRRSS